MGLHYFPEEKLFLLETENSSYAMEISREGYLIHTWWGGRLSRPEDLPVGQALKHLPKRIWGGDWDSYLEPRYREEFPAWHGHLFEEPSLKVELNDGVRAVRPLYASHRITCGANNAEELLEIDLKDPAAGLLLTLVYRLYPGLDVIDRNCCIENIGNKPVKLEYCKSGAWYLPKGPSYRLRHYYGKWSGEYQLADLPMEQNRVCLESKHGVSGHDSNPWFALYESGMGGEERGRLWSGLLHWSGSWKIAVERDRLSQVMVSGGIHDFDFSYMLQPGKRFETPVFTGVYTDRGFSGASKSLHTYIKERVHPKLETLPPVLYNSWDAFNFDFNPEQQLELAKAAAELGIECYIIDDAWFSTRDNHLSGLGDWHPSRKKFPEGIGSFIDSINELGLDFGIWVEPEMVNPDSELYRKHPDWVIAFPGRKPVEKRHQLVLNLAREDVRSFILEFMGDLLRSYNIRYVKWDMNRYIYDPGWPEKDKEEQRSIWFAYVESLYSIFRALRREFPRVYFENCASGGGREDLGMRRFTEFANISDNCDGFDRLRIIEGYSYAYPPSSAALYISDTHRSISKRTTPLRYRSHVAMMGSLGIGLDLNRYGSEIMEELRSYVTFYKSIRHIIYRGDFYRLSSVFDAPAGVYMALLPDTSEGVLFAFGQTINFGDLIAPVRLRALMKEEFYTLYDPDTGRESIPRTGYSLMEVGVSIDLKGDYDSKVLLLKRKEG